MAITFPTIFQSAVTTDPAATAAGYLTPTRFNQGVAPAGLGTNQILYSTDATTLAQSSNLTFNGTSFSVNSSASNTVPSIQLGSTTGGFGKGTNGEPLLFDASAGTVSTLGRTIGIPDNGAYVWRSAYGQTATNGLSRIADGVIGIGTGAVGSFAGRAKLTSVIATGVAVASLNAAPTTGEIQSVTDALNPIAGTAVSAGGSAKALVWYNGAQWTVIGV